MIVLCIIALIIGAGGLIVLSIIDILLGLGGDEKKGS